MLTLSLFPDLIEAGCDEAGRGCLAGPVFAAAVILPKSFECELLRDSKKLTEKIRYKLRPIIEEEALAWGIGIANNKEIDTINILKASFLAMHRAIENLRIVPDYLLIDGNSFQKYRNIPHKCIVKGDDKLLPIAAASVLAKTYRDDYMLDLHNKYPLYGWDKNKGYPTNLHRTALIKNGITPYHRLTFNLLDSQTKIGFID